MLGSEIFFLTNQNVAVKRIFGLDIQVNEVTPANILVIDAQNLYPGYDKATRGQNKIDHILGACLESLILECQSTGTDFHDFQ